MITDAGTIIRTPVCGVPTYSRTASGVIMMRLSEGQTLVNFTKVKRENEENEEENSTENSENVSNIVEGSTENIENMPENVDSSTIESESSDLSDSE
jgi:DNA gyrase subunit A